MFNTILEVILGILLLFLAYKAINADKLIKSVMYLSTLSMLSVVGFAVMQAPDVAVTEAVIGSGMVTALFVFTLLSNRKEVKQ